MGLLLLMLSSATTHCGAVQQQTVLCKNFPDDLSGRTMSVQRMDSFSKK